MVKSINVTKDNLYQIDFSSVVVFAYAYLTH